MQLPCVRKGDNRQVKTLRLFVDPDGIDTTSSQEALDRGAQILRGGGLVALPTETVYGLGANALDAEAVGRIFAAKQRPAWDPVIVHVADMAMVEQLVTGIPAAARKLMEAFWPGPLTLLLPRSSAVPDVVTAGRALVGVRMPAHPAALELIRRAGVPVAAPSANIFAHTSPTTAAHVLDDLDGRIDAVLDAGPTWHGVESTVLDPGQTPMIVYRPGAVTAQQIRETAGAVEVFQSANRRADVPQSALPSPGVGLRHYAPRAQLVLVGARRESLGMRLNGTAREISGRRVGVMLPSGIGLEAAQLSRPGLIVYPWGSWDAPEELARNLYAGLRALDAKGCDIVLCPVPRADGVGAAIRDRLFKACQAGNKGQ